MLKGERPEWESEKLSRRREVARDYRIVLNIGDDLADFLPEVRRATLLEREQARCAADSRWGLNGFCCRTRCTAPGSWRSGRTSIRTRAEPQVKQDCQDP